MRKSVTKKKTQTENFKYISYTHTSKPSLYDYRNIQPLKNLGNRLIATIDY